MDAGVLARPLVALDDVAPRDGHDVLAPAGGQRNSGNPRNLGVLDLERRRFADLLSNQLVEVLHLLGNLLESQERQLPHAVGQHERDAFRTRRHLVERAPNR